MDTPAEKRCAKCGEKKSLDAFGSFARSKDGKRWECLDCRKLVYETNKPEVLAKQAQSRANRTPEQKAAKKAKDAAYYQANKHKWPEQAQKRRENHAEELHIYHAQYYAAHKEQSRASHAAWKKANPEKHKAGEDRRRARKANAPINDLTAAQWQEILIAFDFRCAYCLPTCRHCQRKKHKLTQEHITPYEHNGSHTVWNVIPCCQACNSRKRDRIHPPIPVQPLLLTMAPSKPVKRRKKYAAIAWVGIR